MRVPARETISAAVVGLTAASMGSVELCVLKALDWVPLSGWDDATHSKGQLCSPYDPGFEEFPA